MNIQLYKRARIPLIALLAAMILLAAGQAVCAAPEDYTLMAYATAETSPPCIRLHWQYYADTTSTVVFRKLRDDTSWMQIATVTGTATEYADYDVSIGSAFEYRIERTPAGRKSWLYAGIQVPLVESRGKLILIVDQTYAATLATELERLKQDLIGDGWTVIRHDVVRHTDTWPANGVNVKAVKTIIKQEYDLDPANVKAVFIFGHVPIPYSGQLNPDGHPEHCGAWPADLYYGDVDGTPAEMETRWTDNTVDTTGAAIIARNHNYKGDGKFDQTPLPSDVDLQVGRVDLAEMTAFAAATPSKLEPDLLRQYLNKDHNFRHKIISAGRRAYIDDNFRAHAVSPWWNFPGMFTPGEVYRDPGTMEFRWYNDTIYWVHSERWFQTVGKRSYLWAYGDGGGWFTQANCVGSTGFRGQQYALPSGYTEADCYRDTDAKAVFNMLFGSYFGDWNYENDFLRAPLCTSTYGLTCCWGQRPTWWVHHMSLGENIGFSTRITQNNMSLYDGGYRTIHVALMGDPALRMHMVAPPSDLAVTRVGGNDPVQVKWLPSAEPVLGYHIYGADSPEGPFTRLSGPDPVAATMFLAPSRNLYMVKAVVLENSGSGTYYNTSQGIISAEGVAAPTLNPPGGIYASAQSVIVSCPSADVIHYTTNGNEPTESDPTIASGSAVLMDTSGVLNAKAWKTGLAPSSTTSGEYTIGSTTGKAGAPMFTPAGGTYVEEQTVAISTASSSPTIRYTLDGTDPTEASTQYSVPIQISADTVLKAKVWNASWTPSDVSQADYSLKVSTPGFSPDGEDSGTPESIVVTCITPGAAIHYTTNGLDPTEADPTVDSGSSVLVDGTAVLKARAFRVGWTPSDVKSAGFVVQVSKPVTSRGTDGYSSFPFNVAVTCPTPGVSMHYTVNGDDPTESDPSIAHGGIIAIDQPKTLQIKAWKAGLTPSEVKRVDYWMAVSFTPRPQSSDVFYSQPLDVTIIGGQPDAEIHYTTNGNAPTLSDPFVMTGGVVTLDHTCTLKARAFKDGWTFNGITSVTYNFRVSTPELNPPPGLYGSSREVVITCATPDAAIHYTTNGADPTVDDPAIASGQSVQVSTTQVLRARAFRDGWTASYISGGQYTILTPATVYVDQNAPGPEHNGQSWETAYLTVQEGLNAARSIDDVWVADGLYCESIWFRDGVVLYGGFAGGEQSLAERNPGKNIAVLDGAQAEPVVNMYTFNPRSRIDGFTIQNGFSVYGGGGIYCDWGTCATIANNVIVANSAVCGGGIACLDYSQITMVNNIIAGNSSTDAAGGVFVSWPLNCIMANNTITGNSAPLGGGVACAGCVEDFGMMSNNIIAFNSGEGLWVEVVDNIELHCNDVFGNSGGDYSGISPGTGDISLDPLFLDMDSGDLHLTPGSPCIDTGIALDEPLTDLEGNPRPSDGNWDGQDSFDMGAYELVWNAILVKWNSPGPVFDGKTWATAYHSVQQALDVSAAGDEVWVAGATLAQRQLDPTAGLYIENLTMKDGVKLLGGFEGVEHYRYTAERITILDGGGYGSVVAISSCGSPDTRIDGFTIRNGNADWEQEYHGGGIRVANSCPTISNNIIRDNYAWSGGGIWCSNSSPTIVGNALLDNSAPMTEHYDGCGGGVYCVGGAPVIDLNDISGGFANSGAGIYCMDASVTITDNTISGNSASSDGMCEGGGIYCHGGAVAISGNQIRGNDAWWGGGISCSFSVGSIANNEIAGNIVSGFAAGLYLSHFSASVVNNTIVENMGPGSSSDGGGICLSASSPTIANNIVAFNSSGIWKEATSAPTLNSNDVYGNTLYDYSGLPAGAGDISANPQFANRGSYDYRLVSLSPCIDTGTNTGAPATDKNGITRPVDGNCDGTAVCDIGAHEYRPDTGIMRKGLADGTAVSLSNCGVVGIFAQASGPDWVYVEDEDRAWGIRVLTDNTVAVGDRVSLSGVLGTDSVTGERYVEADPRWLVSPGTANITPLGMRNQWVGGQGGGLIPVIKDGLGFYNVGMLSQTWGRVSSNTQGFFYINDGSGLADGSGYYGVRVILPEGTAPPTIGTYVKVTGISSTVKIGTQFVRAIRLRSVGDIQAVTSWSTGPVAVTQDYWNALALPGIPRYSNPESVFVASYGQPSLYLTGWLSRYDAPTQHWIYYNECENYLFGNCMLGEGYMLYVPGGGCTSIDFQRTPATGDQMLSLPVGSTPVMNFTFIGNPFDAAVPWSSCRITDGNSVLTLANALSAGWIHKVSRWDNTQWVNITDLSTGSMDARKGYEIYTRYNNLAVIVPAQ